LVEIEERVLFEALCAVLAPELQGVDAVATAIVVETAFGRPWNNPLRLSRRDIAPEVRKMCEKVFGYTSSVIAAHTF